MIEACLYLAGVITGLVVLNSFLSSLLKSRIEAERRGER